MTIYNRQHITGFIGVNKEGCLCNYKGKIVRIKKVKTFKWSALVVIASANHPWQIKVVKMSRVEPMEMYYPLP